MLILGRGIPLPFFIFFNLESYVLKVLKQLVNKNLNSGTQGKPPIYYIKYLHN